ncbi:hypothetical protein ZWY2020_008524 [Hordeum vulgare]|nr:hypothetical protein ZWY2020_008524 [Hordeum vulgare]
MTLSEVGSVPRRRRTAPPPAATGIGRHGSTHAKVGGGSCGCAVAPVAAAVARPEPAEGEGRILAADQSLPPWAAPAAAALRPHAAFRRRAQSSPSKKRKKRRLLDGVFWAGVGMESASPSGSATADDPSLDEIGVVDGELRAVLKGIGASRPVRVYGKRLHKTDRVLQQHRLLIPCKSRRRRGEPFPLDEALTAEEKPCVQVQAYDRRGRPYVLDLKKLSCNDAYRLIAGWGRFLTQNGLDVARDARPRTWSRPWWSCGRSGRRRCRWAWLASRAARSGSSSCTTARETPCTPTPPSRRSRRRRRQEKSGNNAAAAAIADCR